MKAIAKPKLATYVGDCTQIERAIKLGVDHLILEHPRLSIRSWQQPSIDNPIPAIERLIKYAKSLNQSIELSLNMDMLIQHNQDDLIAQLSAWIVGSSLQAIRVQDVGLLHHFHGLIECVLDSQMGNINWVGVKTLATLAKRQCLSLDIAYPDIDLIYEKTQARLELMVHGPICIQYSQRRYMQGLFDQQQPSAALSQYHQLAEDDDYPGRRFTFLDNPHGHFMFAYFDRSLLHDLDQLKQCPLDYWVIDTRGQDSNYHQACIKAYRCALDANDLDNKNLQAAIKTVKSLAPKPLKPGFFRANQTDRRRFKKRAAQLNEEETSLGVVLDIWEKRWVIIECLAPLNCGDQVAARHPKIADCQFELNQLFDLNHQKLASAQPGQLIKIPWVKGLQQQSILVGL